MELLTVLGTGKYEETCYVWKDQQAKTRYVAEALCEFFQPSKVTVFVTEEAKAMHWNGLQEKLGDRFSVNDVLIPSGKSEAEVWQIFEKVVCSVEQNSSIIFDITHAFRSIPLLVLLAAAFLKKARNVEIEGVYYGAFEVNREQPPIFDLTPAIKLLDWLTATDKFINTGSSLELGQLLSTIQRDFYRNNNQKQSEIRPTRLLSFGERIQAISRSIELIRPIDLMNETARLQNTNTSQLESEIGIFAKPFELLLSQIQQDYGQFARLNNELNTPLIELKKQFILLQWYVNKKFSSQAILLGREWLISALCIADGIIDYREHERREIIEKQLNKMKGANGNLEQPIANYVIDARKLANFWSTLADYRNDIAHAQMRRTNLSASTLQNYVENILTQELLELFPQFTSSEE